MHKRSNKLRNAYCVRLVDEDAELVDEIADALGWPSAQVLREMARVQLCKAKPAQIALQLLNERAPQMAD